jgi:hypothetical protein
MNRIATFAGMAATVLCLYLPASTAQAQATRTWVSGVGDDANPCSRTAPCKTFAGAISKTAPAGEINCLDPGGFGAVTITKSMTIDCSETFGSVLVSGTNGIVISGAGIRVTLRNLDIQGLNTGLSGVLVLNAAEVIIDHCRIAEFATAAINVQAGGTIGGQILDTAISQTPTGIVVGTAAGTAIFAIKNARIDSTTSAGVQAGAGGQVSVVDSLITNAPGSATLTTGLMFVTNSAIQSAGTAFNAGAGGTMFVNNNDVISSTVAFNTAGTILSSGNNRIATGTGAPNGNPITLK